VSCMGEVTLNMSTKSYAYGAAWLRRYASDGTYPDPCGHEKSPKSLIYLGLGSFQVLPGTMFGGASRKGCHQFRKALPYSRNPRGVVLTAGES
jgi:hypothetical protein